MREEEEASSFRRKREVETRCVRKMSYSQAKAQRVGVTWEKPPASASHVFSMDIGAPLVTTMVGPDALMPSGLSCILYGRTIHFLGDRKAIGSSMVTRGAPTPIQNTCEDMEDTSGFPVTWKKSGLRGPAEPRLST